MKTIKHITLLLLLFPILLIGQNTGELTGNITDKNTGKPLKNINIKIEKIMQGTSSDAKGNYDIKRIKIGKYKVLFSALGYQNQYRNIFINQGKTTILNVQLSEKSENLDEILVLPKVKPEKYVNSQCRYLLFL